MVGNHYYFHISVFYSLLCTKAHNLAESLNVIVKNEHFGRDEISVNLQWSNHDTDNPRISLNVSTMPVVQPILTSLTGVTFTVAYNTFYNVSVVATLNDAVCDRVRTSLIPLHYSELTS